MPTAFVRWLILAHRYLGITLGLLFVVWFASGIAMIYVGDMPAISPADRIERLPPLDITRTALSPSEAAARAGLQTPAARVRLFTILDRPAYRFTGSQTVTIFADTGEPVPTPDVHTAQRLAAAFLDVEPSRLTFAERLTVADQWTLGQRRQMPLDKFTADDVARTEIYVSEPAAEVVMMTTRRSRMLSWAGPIPHWIYFAALRRNDAVWRQVVLWTSGLGSLLAVLGLIIGFRQRRARYTGWLKWHQWTGLVFGLFTLTWVFSGLLSMEPADWAASDRALGAALTEHLGGAIDARALSQRPSEILAGQVAKEVEWQRILGTPHIVVRGAGNPMLVDASTGEARHRPLGVDAITAAVGDAVSPKAIASIRLLTQPDSYYYAREAVFPVVRVVLNDPAETWIHIDPALTRLVSVVNRRDRVERWLYHGLHSLDFSIWYRRRPLWDAGMIALCAGGLATSVLGVILGVKRVRRFFQRP